MTYEELTVEQRAQVQALDAHIRRVARAADENLAAMQILVDFYDAGVGDLVLSMSPGTPIPTETGFAGAQSVTMESYVGTIEDFRSVLEGHYGPQNRLAFRRWLGVNVQ